jgi:hypothetical protein
MDINKIDDRWNLIGQLVEASEIENAKTAWMLCRGDYGELRMHIRELEKEIVRLQKLAIQTSL